MTWQDVLQEYKSRAEFQDTINFVAQARASGKQIFPEKSDVFNAFKLCQFDQLKIVILGQDPYHNVSQAHGLAFSVQNGIKVPPSLVNIYKELHSDLGMPIPEQGNLTQWAEQGVFLLNSVLSVEAHKAHSHANIGWEKFTDHVIQKISNAKDHVVFMLWGAPAQKKAKLIDESKHLILKAPHPSPLSAYRGFFGCKHFSKANAYLQAHSKPPIKWQL